MYVGDGVCRLREAYVFVIMGSGLSTWPFYYKRAEVEVAETSWMPRNSEITRQMGEWLSPKPLLVE